MSVLQRASAQVCTSTTLLSELRVFVGHSSFSMPGFFSLLLQGMRGLRNPPATRAPALFDGALEECESWLVPPGMRSLSLLCFARGMRWRQASLSLSPGLGHLSKSPGILAHPIP